MTNRPDPPDPLDFHVGRTRDTQGTTAANSAIIRAQNLAGMVRDEGPDAIGRYLDALDRGQLYALTVALAAMVDVDQTPADLLAWITEPDPGQPALPIPPTPRRTPPVRADREDSAA